MLLLLIGCNAKTYAQISPGELAKVHSHLEGMSNCTQCHTLGAKVSNSKCLICHTEIKERIDQQKGYHASTDVEGNECVSCHNDHHGLNFQIVHFEASTFQHDLTGYKLEGSHNKQKCSACHNSDKIVNPKLKERADTYLGLDTKCLSCHTDYHQKTLPENCSNCHNQESFKPAPKFDHSNTKFPLLGKHQSVDCSKCHKIEPKNGEKFQNFAGIPHNNCTNCHKDIHEKKFGDNCKQCHSEVSFHKIKNTTTFDHNKTGYKLEGKHKNTSCTSCHKTSLTASLKHTNCSDCHSDYHIGQFAQSGATPDCKKCHSVYGFTPSNYTIEKHNKSKFELLGAHEATACFECHKKQVKWSFRDIGNSCIDCHKDEHQSTISARYYPEKNCKNCHSETKWSQVNFDHSKTDFKLTGGHSTTNCKACHYKKDNKGIEEQKFTGLDKSCINCHKDNHNHQFEKNGITDCTECHSTDNWKESKFDHNNTAFKLDGKHQNVACIKCHKPVEGEKYIQYKLKDFRCETCHY